MQNPNPDPGEYQHVNTALFSIVNPITNQFLDAGAMLSRTTHPARNGGDDGASSGTIATTSSRSTSATRRSKNIG
jgi:hypothetical protein